MMENQFEQLINLLGERLPNAYPQPVYEAQTPAHNPLAELVREQRVSWAQLPRLDLSSASELDTWFISFEARMKAARVMEENWPARFLECPAVEESTKVHVRELEPFTYEALRSLILKEHGPVDPVNYFKREMFRVRGDKREEVRETLMRILVKHNRAAKSAGVQEMQDRDLCYPFIDAFPLEIKQALEQKLALVFAQDEPFEHLFRLAPSKQDIARVCVAETSAEAAPIKSLQDEVREAVVLAMKDVGQTAVPSWKRRQLPINKAGPPKFARKVVLQSQSTYRCFGCGSPACRDRQQCPAKTVVCFRCNKQGHFQKVCRDRTQTTPFQQGPRPQ